MLKIENTEVLGWEHAIRGMRNPMNSWEKSDSNLYHTSVYFDECNERWETDGHRFMIGPNDLDLIFAAILCIVEQEFATVPTLYVSNSFHQYSGPVRSAYTTIIRMNFR